MGNFIKAEKIIPMLNLNLNIFPKFQINQNITLCSNSDFLQGYCRTSEIPRGIG
jgi:hypothetical protein